jgi:dTDP-4-dehydrorhamnose reductase
MNTILITGSNGQLGNELRKLESGYTDYKFIFTDIVELDITNPMAIEEMISSHKVKTIINCAAYTAVDKAESESEMAMRINAKAPQYLAETAKKFNALLVHISTDYVFSGHGFLPYKEDDPCDPQSVYGSTKLKGEEAVINSHCKAIIIRTSWLYSAFGHNFIKTMRKYGAERGYLKVVFDQIGTPTWAGDLAKAILEIIPQVKSEGTAIYHFSNEGVCSWYDFAIEILAQSGIPCKVDPIETKDYPSPVARPYYSVLNKNKIKQDFKLTIPYWKESLSKCLFEIETMSL